MSFPKRAIKSKIHGAMRRPDWRTRYLTYPTTTNLINYTHRYSKRFLQPEDNLDSSI